MGQKHFIGGWGGGCKNKSVQSGAINNKFRI